MEYNAAKDGVGSVRKNQPNAKYFKKGKDQKPKTVKPGRPTSKNSKNSVRSKKNHHRRVPSELRSESYEKNSYYKDFESDLMFIRHPTESSKDKLKMSSRSKKR
jgi:hypothetical protein